MDQHQCGMRRAIKSALTRRTRRSPHVGQSLSGPRSEGQRPDCRTKGEKVSEGAAGHPGDPATVLNLSQRSQIAVSRERRPLETALYRNSALLAPENSDAAWSSGLRPCPVRSFTKAFASRPDRVVPAVGRPGSNRCSEEGGRPSLRGGKGIEASAFKEGTQLAVALATGDKIARRRQSVSPTVLDWIDPSSRGPLCVVWGRARREDMHDRIMADRWAYDMVPAPRVTPL